MNVVKFVFNTIKGTPLWVWIIFAYLLVIGIQGLQKRTTKIYKLFIIPSLFLFWGFYSLFYKLIGFFDVSIWLLALITGTLIGWIMSYSRTITIDRKNHLITLPGNYLTLILVLLIFSIKYFFGYLYATSTFARESNLVHVADIIVTGMITGILIGRASNLINKYLNKKN